MKALYHQNSGSVELEVIGKPKDGRADLGKDKVVLVGGCLISKEPVLGTCTLLKEDSDDAKKGAADEAAAAARKAAEEAEKAKGTGDLNLAPK